MGALATIRSLTPQQVFCGGDFGIGDSGAYIAVLMGEGDDTISNAGRVIGDLEFWEGDDVLSGAGSIVGAIVMDDLQLDDLGNETQSSAATDGNDRVNIGAGGLVEEGFIYMGHGNNRLINAGTVDARAGEDTLGGSELGFIAFTGTSVMPDFESAVIWGRSGADVVNNTASGTIYGAVNLGAGDDTVSNAGRMFMGDELLGEGLISTGTGNDRLTNAGTIGREIPMFSGGRFSVTNLFPELLNPAVVINIPIAVAMGAGDDLLANSGNIYGIISMGDGNDTVRGGTSTELVVEEDGADSYLLGAGADGVLVRVGDGYVDTFNGGLGLDLLGFETTNFNPNAPAPNGHLIDLTAQRIIYDVTSGAATVSGSANVEIDIIIGFEQVVGSLGDDFIYGSAANETLSGDFGDDVIRGGGGRDILFGNDGADSFVFTAQSDSGRTSAARDVISDYDVGAADDSLVFLFDSNTNVAGTQNAFVFAGMDAAFSGSAGSIRAYQSGGVTIVEVDTNGDSRADFSLELTGAHTLTGSDFVFV